MEMVGKSGPTWAFESGWHCYPQVDCNFQMPHTLIHYYRAIELSSTQMLAFAAASDWSRVSDCAQFCGELIQQLGRTKLQSGLTAGQQAEKKQIMMRILAIDAQIRHLAEPAAARYAQQYRHSATRTH
jgi:flagellar protein FliT